MVITSVDLLRSFVQLTKYSFRVMHQHNPQPSKVGSLFIPFSPPMFLFIYSAASLAVGSSLQPLDGIHASTSPTTKKTKEGTSFWCDIFPSRFRPASCGHGATTEARMRPSAWRSPRERIHLLFIFFSDLDLVGMIVRDMILFACLLFLGIIIVDRCFLGSQVFISTTKSL